MNTKSKYEYDNRYIENTPILGEFYKLNILKLLKDFEMVSMELDFAEIDDTGRMTGFVDYDDVYRDYKRAEENPNLFFCLGRCKFVNKQHVIFDETNGARFMFGRFFVYLENRVINKYMEHVKL